MLPMIGDQLPEWMPDSFWEWVASRNAGDNPRGDFIRDTRTSLAAGSDPNVWIASATACAEAREEFEKLRKRWESC